MNNPCIKVDFFQTLKTRRNQAAFFLNQLISQKVIKGEVEVPSDANDYNITTPFIWYDNNAYYGEQFHYFYDAFPYDPIGFRPRIPATSLVVEGMFAFNEPGIVFQNLKPSQTLLLDDELIQIDINVNNHPVCLNYKPDKFSFSHRYPAEDFTTNYPSATIISIPYAGCTDYLKIILTNEISITQNQSDAQAFLQIWNDPIASVTKSIDDVIDGIVTSTNHLIYLPIELVNADQTCKLLDHFANNDNYFNPASLLHILNVKESSKALEIINCLEGDQLVGRLANKLNRKNRINFFWKLNELYYLSGRSSIDLVDEDTVPILIDGEQMIFIGIHFLTKYFDDYFYYKSHSNGGGTWNNLYFIEGNSVQDVDEQNLGSYFGKTRVGLGKEFLSPEIEILYNYFDGEGIEHNDKNGFLEVPNVYIAYAIENYIANQDAENIANLIDVASIVSGYFALKSSIQIISKTSMVRAFGSGSLAVAEIGSGTIGLLLNETDVCSELDGFTDTAGQEFCESLKNCMDMAQLILLFKVKAPRPKKAKDDLYEKWIKLTDDQDQVVGQKTKFIEKYSELYKLFIKIDSKVDFVKVFENIDDYAKNPANSVNPNILSDFFDNTHINNYLNKIYENADLIKSFGPEIGYKLFDDILSTANQANKIGGDLVNLSAGRVNAWKKVNGTQYATKVSFLEQIVKWSDEGFEVNFSEIDGVLKIKNSDDFEIAEIVTESGIDYIHLGDDLFAGTSEIITKNIEFGFPVRNGSDLTEDLINARLVIADGKIKFIEDVVSYGDEVVQLAIKNRGDLRKQFPNILNIEEAHHFFPVKSLKENQWVKKGVSGGYAFNTPTNGMPLQKFRKGPPPSGRHSNHPKYTKQITDHMDWWADQTSTINGISVKNKDLSPAQTAEYMQSVSDDVKDIINDPLNATIKINDLDLGLDHF